MRPHTLILFLALLAQSQAFAQVPPAVPASASSPVVGAQSAATQTTVAAASAAFAAPLPQTINLIMPSQAPPSEWDFWLDRIEKFLKLFAYVVGTLWVVWNYSQGRTHKPRLEVKVSLTPVDKHPELLKITSQVKNVGLSKVEIVAAGTGIVLSGHAAAQAYVDWIELQVHDVWKGHWVEPGSTLEEQTLLVVEANKYACYKAELRVNTSKSTCTSSCIISMSTP